MPRHSFFCIDGHTCGNPVRLVAGGGPRLAGDTMMEKRAHFLREFDWIRTGLMFEPRGHDMLSGSILYPPTRPDCDVAILFIETSGCLPMCGHGTIGTVTFALEHGLVTPNEDAASCASTRGRRGGRGVPPGRQQHVEEVASTPIRVLPPFHRPEGGMPVLGELSVDVAYGGNFYAIVEPQKNFRDMADHSAGDLIAWSHVSRQRLNDAYRFVHPANADIKGLSHILWTGAAASRVAHAATRCSTATRRSIAVRVEPAPRRGWRSSMRGAGLGNGRGLRSRVDHRGRCSGGASKPRDRGRRPSRDHPVDRRLGTPDGSEHHLHRYGRDPFAHGFVVDVSRLSGTSPQAPHDLGRFLHCNRPAMQARSMSKPKGEGRNGHVPGEPCQKWNTSSSSSSTG